MKLSPPLLKYAGSFQTIPAAQLQSDITLEQVRLTDFEATSLIARSLAFDEAIFEKVTLTQAKLEKLSIGDAELTTCNLSAVDCNNASCIRVCFKDCRLTGIDFSRSTLKDVLFDTCKLDMANFRFSKLNRVTFRNCVLDEADFQEAELHEVSFALSHLSRVELTHAKLTKVDARSATLHDLRGWSYLHGLIIDGTQLIAIAPELAAELGIHIEP